MVENSLFPDAALAPILEKQFVEIALHVDLKPRHGERYEKYHARISELREKFIGSGNPSIPQFFILDPSKPEEVLLRKVDGAGGGVDSFLAFFQEALKKAGR